MFVTSAHMPLSNAQLCRYDSEVLRLPPDKREEYREQVERLIESLKRDIASETDIKVTNVMKAGSFAKSTILRKTSEDPVDVDVVFYLSGVNGDAAALELEEINEMICQMLSDAYRNKPISDFKIQRKAATVSFVQTGLKVDVVPVIEDSRRPDSGYGWQFDLKNGSRVQTCAPCQIEFVQKRKQKDRHYRTLVRLAKKWRNHAELEPLKSFMIELIMAYLLDREGAEGAIETRLQRFLLYIAQSGLKEKIRFPENTYMKQFSDPVVIVDPVCDENNIASRITESEREEIIKAAQDAWETLHFASVEDDYSIWKEIFGSRFQVEN